MKSYIVSAVKNVLYFRAELPADRFGNAYYPELVDSSPNARRNVSEKWNGLDVKWELAPSCKSAVFSDAMGFGKTIRGMETLVSDATRKVLSEHLEGECVFLPITLSGSTEKYYFLYITRLLDCLDERTSRFSREIPGMPTLISVPRFRESDVSGYLFRIGGGRYQFDYDFATERFWGLVKHLGLKGFCFRENLGSEQYCL